MLAGSVAALVVLAAGLFFIGLPTGHSHKQIMETAYQKLESGQLDEAAQNFQRLVDVRPAAAYEGLAAVALRQNELAKAESLCNNALRLDLQRPSCMLILGDLYVLKNDPKRASGAYEAVIALSGITAAQQSVAYNRLGRLAAEEGKAEQAVAAYTKAQEIDPRNWESLSNLGALFQRQGRYAEATGLLKKATALRPDDPIVQALLNENREAIELAKDHKRQEQINGLIEELTHRYKQGKFVRPPAKVDEWTSRPLTVCLLGLENHGRMPFREGEHEFFLIKLGQVLEELARVRLVERNVLDKLLDELKLSTSSLVNPQTALRLGHLLSARLILVGSINTTDTEWQLTIRVIETETSTVIASVAQGFALNYPVHEAAGLVGKQLSEKLLRSYPLRARVIGVGNREITLNIGAEEGAVPGLQFQIFRESVQGQREVVAKVELVEIKDRSSRAKLLGKRVPLVIGLKASHINLR